MEAIIVIRSGIAAVVIIAVIWNARAKSVNRRAILELSSVKWIWNVKVAIVTKPATLTNVIWTAAGKIVKHRSVEVKEMYVKWI